MKAIGGCLVGNALPQGSTCDDAFLIFFFTEDEALLVEEKCGIYAFSLLDVGSIFTAYAISLFPFLFFSFHAPGASQSTQCNVRHVTEVVPSCDQLLCCPGLRLLSSSALLLACKLGRYKVSGHKEKALSGDVP